MADANVHQHGVPGQRSVKEITGSQSKRVLNCLGSLCVPARIDLPR